MLLAVSACDDDSPASSTAPVITATIPLATTAAPTAGWSSANGCREPDAKERIALSRANDASSCITWLDRSADETGFVIRLEFTNSGERFEWSVPANSTEFILPDSAQPTGEPGSPEWSARKDFSLQVVARTPRGDEPVGAIAVTVQ